MGGTLINRKKGTYWLGSVPAGIHIPSRTNNTTYIRIHGERGYKKYYDSKKLREIKRRILKNNTEKNFVMFNNVFFTKRNRTCKVKTKKIRYAAVCDAVLFGRMTRRRK